MAAARFRAAVFLAAALFQKSASIVPAADVIAIALSAPNWATLAIDLIDCGSETGVTPARAIEDDHAQWIGSA